MKGPPSQAPGGQGPHIGEIVYLWCEGPKKVEISDFKVFSSWEIFMIFKWTNLYFS